MSPCGPASAERRFRSTGHTPQRRPAQRRLALSRAPRESAGTAQRADQRLLLAAAGAGGTRILLGAALDRSAGATARRGWPLGLRRNYRDRSVVLVGPAVALAAGLCAAAGAARPAVARSALGTALAAGALGFYDDLAGQRPAEQSDRGIGGHLAALRAGRVSAGAVKAVGLALTGVAAAGSLAGPAGATGLTRRPAGRPLAGARLDRLVAGGVIAGLANLINLFDRRPGRALKVALALGLPLLPTPAGPLVAGPLGVVAAALPADLAEEAMLGDCGANALGAVLGLAVVAGGGPRSRALVLALVAGLTAVSERVSFTDVIARVPALRWLDDLGRPSDIGSTTEAAPATEAGRTTEAARPQSPARPDRPAAGLTGPSAGPC